MKASELIRKFQKMYEEHWSYELGAAREGCVDCSGAFTLTLKLPHGSNTIYRKNIGWVSSIPVPGYAAFKIKKDNGEPEKYKGDGIGNVYHIGLVDTDAKHVLNAKGTKWGFCRDTIDGWTCFAPINGVDYEERTEDMPETLYIATVNTNGGNLNLRAAPSVNGQKITSIPNGYTVEVVAEHDGWHEVKYGKLQGYVKSSFLTWNDGSDEEISNDTTTLINEEGVAVTLVGNWRIAAD